MSSTKSDISKSAAPAKGTKALRQDARIDPAHPMNSQGRDQPQPAISDAGLDLSSAESMKEGTAPILHIPPQNEQSSRQIQRQAEQLAEHLRTRQNELDHRQSQLNAAIAQFESDVRASRMSLSEREADQDQRKEELDKLELEIRERLDRLAAAEAALHRQNVTENIEADSSAQIFVENERLVQQIESLKKERIEWEAKRFEEEKAVQARQIEALKKEREEWEATRRNEENNFRARHLEALKKEREEWEQKKQQEEKSLHAERQKLDSLKQESLRPGRHAQTDEAEKRLAKAQVEIEKLHEQLSAQRRTLKEEIRQERRQMVAEQRRTIGELEKKREHLQKRAEHVDQCRTALVKLRAELRQMHRETLEIRLATEELWIQLSGAAPPAALTQSLGRIRNRLADQYRSANAELIEQKKELENIRDQMVEQFEKLTEQKKRFDQWMSCKQEETQQQASMLVARERQISEQQTHFDEQTEKWKIERMRFEHEVRRLRDALAETSEQPAVI